MLMIILSLLKQNTKSILVFLDLLAKIKINVMDGTYTIDDINFLSRKKNNKYYISSHIVYPIRR